jgi:hypothetical protein
LKVDFTFAVATFFPFEDDLAITFFAALGFAFVLTSFLTSFFADFALVAIKSP